MMGAVDFDEVADELYAALPGEFIAARDDAVAAAKRTDKVLARRLGALGKPTLAGWTVNTLVRSAGDQVQELVSLGELLRSAQDSLDPEAMRELGKQRPHHLLTLAREAARLARRAGHPVSEQVVGQVEETLRAAVADPAAGEAVLSGRLTGALSYNGLGTPEPAARPAGPARRPPARAAAPEEPEQPAAPPVDLDAARAAKADRAARREAEERLRRARAELRTARTVADDAAGEVEQAATAAHEAEQAAAEARRGRDDADRRVTELESALEAARERATAAADDVTQAEDAAARAEDDRQTARAEAERAAEQRDRAQQVVDELS